MSIGREFSDDWYSIPVLYSRKTNNLAHDVAHSLDVVLPRRLTMSKDELNQFRTLTREDNQKHIKYVVADLVGNPPPLAKQQTNL